MLFRVPQLELQEMSELILQESDSQARFDAALHDKELPHTVWSVGSPREGQSTDERIREKNAWQRVNALKTQKQAGRY